MKRRLLDLQISAGRKQAAKTTKLQTQGTFLHRKGRMTQGVEPRT